jgi:pimeloyl-ACP methyl ester carboxylesterase
MPQVDGVTHRMVQTSRLRVHLAEAGPADGEPVLLLHGWPQHWYEWRGLVPVLSQRYRMLMPDLRGLGWSDAPRDGYEKEELARDQIALLDALGIERVKLVGHDWGGFAGFLLCLLAPERVEKFVATNIIHPWPKPSVKATLNFWRMAYQLPMLAPLLGPRVSRIPGFIKFFLEAGKRGVFTPADLEAFEAPYRDPSRAFTSAKYYRSFQAHDLPLMLRRHWNQYRLTVPTLMLVGDGDLVITRDAIAGYEPHADDMRVEFVGRTGHFIIDAVPDLVAERTMEFFAAR